MHFLDNISHKKYIYKGMRRHRNHHFLFMVLLIGACGLHWILVFERQIRDDGSHKFPSALQAKHSFFVASSNMYVHWISSDNFDEDCYITCDCPFEQVYR